VSHQGLDQLEGRAEYLQEGTLILVTATSYKSRVRKIAKTRDTISKNTVSSIFYNASLCRMDNYGAILVTRDHITVVPRQSHVIERTGMPREDTREDT